MNHKILKGLYDSTLKTLQSTGIPILIWDEKKQSGSDFAEKIHHGFLSAFASGYRNVIAVGSDSPALSTRHLKRAEKSLTDGKLALGKSKDGGIFLLGMNQLQFDSSAFLKLKWKSKYLIQSLALYIEKLGLKSAPVGLLEDLDTIQNFKAYLTSNPFSHLVQIIQNILFQYRYTQVNYIYSNHLIFIKNRHYKAPPSYS